MKNLIYRIIIINLSCLLMFHCFNTAEYVYGEENKGFITEGDIIITTDDLDKVPDVEVSEKSVAPDVKKEVKKGLQSYKLVSEYLKNGKKYEARNELSDLYFTETDKARRDEMKSKLDELNAELVFSHEPSPDAFIYVVRPGDTLIGIASKYNTNYEFIVRINNKHRTSIKVGERLKILKGNVTVLVDKSDYTLTLLLDGRFIKQYPVGIGKSDKTPVGKFIVDNKLINPVWYSPDGIYQFGDPNNILGTRWIGFEDKNGLYGYGIHGTTDPDSIGKEMSNGCIRLRNEDVEDLFDYVKPKLTVVIQK
ncbi:MAG: L,D-transpeptidase family protein [Candidatus Scalindua sp.]|nr:L,D-transpeptidase family protein [Candidatus Scalindua sp.]